VTSGFAVVVPARLGSTRLPGKVLLPIHGRPMIEHVWQAARRSGATDVVVATDDARVADVARGFGADVCMTAATHPSGTDRLADVVAQRGWPETRIVVNLQGDEPLMPPELLDAAAALLDADATADIATFAHPIHAAADFANPNVVKVVCDARGHALYFSRAPIPCWRDGGGGLPSRPGALRHIGLYAYRVAALKRFSTLPAAPLETCESLEQLRALHHGLCIAVGVLETPPPHGVDTQADLEAVIARLAADDRLRHS
jgi:3-deoxy-manno-octulosonate cytidylyltransferase (CMP-KDO synthetase)